MRLTRITLVIIALIILAGFNLLVKKQVADVEPQLFQATEEAMVDTANFLAAMIERDFRGGKVDWEGFTDAMQSLGERDPGAEIYKHEKSQIGLEFYVTDAEGMVVYDSAFPERVGKDFSQKRDVFLTLKGKYGARSSREEESEDTSSVLHVAAPIGQREEPLGVVTVTKPQADVLPIIRRRISEIWWGTGLVGGGIFLCVLVIFVWLYRPLALLTGYAQNIEKGKRVSLPYLGIGKEVNTLAGALESMRESLEGRKFAESYVQTLTHEMKSPLAGISGAAELLEDDLEGMPKEDRERFLANIREESGRAGRLLTRLLELSALEGKATLDSAAVLDLGGLVEQAISEVRPMAEMAGVELKFAKGEGNFKASGDPFILRAAISNLLENAVDFSPLGGVVEIGLEELGGMNQMVISDRGPGVPEYAVERVFERFFSLKQMTRGRKGTGLGLTLVKEAAELHFGSVKLVSRDGGGTAAVLEIPVSQ